MKILIFDAFNMRKLTKHEHLIPCQTNPNGEGDWGSHELAGPDDPPPKVKASHFWLSYSRVSGYLGHLQTIRVNLSCILFNHKSISLTPIITKILALIIFRRLKNENQAKFRSIQTDTDHVFTLCQHPEHRTTFYHLTFAPFLDMKAAFDSVDR